MGTPHSTAREAAEPVSARLTYAGVFAVSFPIIISNVTTPLLGVTHTAVVGQLGESHLIGAVALGATVFTLLFWAFGFLRMGTTGLTAQAEGAGRKDTLATVLGQALLLGGAAGLALIILQKPIELIALEWLQASAAAESELQTYFAIRIWSAPFALINYVFLGWFIGLARTRTALWLQIILNGLNVVLSVFFVSWAGWGVSGVAISTLIAEIVAAAVGAKLAGDELKQRGAAMSWALIQNLQGLKRMLQVNSDLMIRTLCLLFAMTFFTAEAAKSGDDILAANAILLQFLGVSAYLLDGFAFATEALVGRAIGASTRTTFRRAIHLSSVWAVGIAIVVSALYYMAGGFLIDMITTNAQVREIARIYLPWAVAAPVAGVASFLLDGIFIGATQTRDMRNMMIVSFAVFLGSWAALTPAYGNHGLWASLIIFFLIRAITLGLYFPALQRTAFRN